METQLLIDQKLHELKILERIEYVQKLMIFTRESLKGYAAKEFPEQKTKLEKSLAKLKAREEFLIEAYNEIIHNN